MWIEGRRRGGAANLAKHLQKVENESVAIRAIEGFTFAALTPAHLEAGLKQMEACGYGKRDKRNLYHAILAPPYGTTLTPEQRDRMVATYIKQMGFKGHQYVLVEHWKKRKQHFHLVVNIIHPLTGKTHELKFTRRKEWRLARELETLFGHAAPEPKGKSSRPWQMQRGARSGIDPRKLRQDITALFHACTTATDFVQALDKAGYSLTRGRRQRLVVVDKSGDTHGLMRMIEGKTLADLRRTFPGIETHPLPSHAALVKARKPVGANKRKAPKSFLRSRGSNPRRVQQKVRKACYLSISGAAFLTRLNRHHYSLGHGLKGYAVIDQAGKCYEMETLLGATAAQGLSVRFPDLATLKLRPVSEISRHSKAGRKAKNTSLVHNAPRSCAVASDYAGILGDLEAPQATRRKKGDGKGDGAGGGMGAILSVFRTASLQHVIPTHAPYRHKNAPAQALDRRRRTLWVAVERRSRKPPDHPAPPPQL